MHQLEKIAHHMGVHIIEDPHLTPALNGCYLHHRRLIVLQYHLDPYTKRCTLAHELGHATFGDQGPCTLREERRADQFAAHLLIRPEDYAAAEQQHEGHLGAIAHELEVTPHLVRVWRDMWVTRGYAHQNI